MIFNAALPIYVSLFPTLNFSSVLTPIRMWVYTFGSKKLSALLTLSLWGKPGKPQLQKHVSQKIRAKFAAVLAASLAHLWIVGQASQLLSLLENRHPVQSVVVSSMSLPTAVTAELDITLGKVVSRAVWSSAAVYTIPLKLKGLQMSWNLSRHC